MFAFIASRDASHTADATGALAHLARQHAAHDAKIKQLSISNLRVDYFDTASELAVYENDRYLLLVSGTLVNEEALRKKFGIASGGVAELLLQMYESDRRLLKELDGHLSLVLCDVVENSITVMADRFHRYSIVYSLGDSLYVSSHSYLLQALTPSKQLDLNAFSQAIHFRWLTGERKLFLGIQQVLPGSITCIDSRCHVSKEAYSVLRFNRDNSDDLEHWVQEVDSAIDRCFAQIASKHDVIGVPLSGGVDSSLLLAKAQEHFSECVAVTARFVNGENPELDNACRIAREVGVRHVIADIDDDYISDFFPTLIRLHEQPPRNFSDIALARSFEALASETDAFLYGEAADTLFGLSAVHNIVDIEHLSRPFMFLPGGLRKLAARLLPEKGHRLKRLKWAVAHGMDALVNSIEKIPYATPPWHVFSCTRSPKSDEVLNEFLWHDQHTLGDRAALQLLATGVMNHVENTGRLATYYGLNMYVPFLLNDLRSVAERLPFELQKVDGVYKRVLRELACRYFDREYIYTDKFGFPTPTKQWLKGPLYERVLRATNGEGKGRTYYSVNALSELSVDADFEHFWFAICLDEIMAQLAAQSEGMQVAA
jgi:asparagine synthase (glutamine-hydrolysing)